MRIYSSRPEIAFVAIQLFYIIAISDYNNIIAKYICILYVADYQIGEMRE